MASVTVKHFCNIGDIIASLASCKSFYLKTGKKILYCQQLNVEGSYYAGATHPTISDEGKMVMVNQKMFDMIRPLLLAQEYIEDMQVYNGQKINIDFDVIRKKFFVNIPHQAIQQWLFMAYPDIAYDLSTTWIDIPEVDISNCALLYKGLTTTTMPIENLESKVIINFTERYRNAHLNYYFLKKHQKDLIFAGTQREFQLFCDKWELDIPLLMVNDFLEYAYIIKKAKFLLSNQSFAWNISAAIRSPHLLELCEFAPNTQCFFAPKSFGHYHQFGMEFYFNELLK